MFATLHLRHRLRQFARQQHGAVAPFAILLIGGALLTTAFVIEQSRALENTAQLKRATDAAAMAVGNQRLLDDRLTDAQMQSLAAQFVRANLGTDRELIDQVDAGAVSVQQQRGQDGKLDITVAASFLAQARMLGAKSQQLRVSSTAEVVNRPVEIAFVVPNTDTEGTADLGALRRMTKNFATQVIGTRPDAKTWISLVPYSQIVNVYDANDSNRLRRWATPEALTPIELRSLFRTGYSGLADQRMPDRRAKLLCLYRGLGQGQNYFWDQTPSGQFKIYYRHDLAENGSPGASPISWVGPNPDFGQPTGANDTRWLVADKGCPAAPVLPLTRDINAIESRAEQYATRFNVNYAIAMGWAAMTLSPRMRGSNGWGNNELPLDFNADGQGDNTKIIVMLGNTKGDWFDTDARNAEVGKPIDGDGATGTSGAVRLAAERFVLLCQSFRARGLKFHFIGVRPGDPDDFGRGLFGRVAVPGLQLCAANGSLTFANAENFADGEAQIQALLDKIAQRIKHERFVRLID
ncbi:TadE/TadG family type IV pilus assembly protein [Pseudomonas sp. NPDC090592]|uniref:TadE/TadG family type IV pilus assembly protein n=1 Tax=Pseudomonas sp. NPDC090592 TaxID=3364480 RepID=UPI00383A5EF3